MFYYVPGRKLVERSDFPALGLDYLSECSAECRSAGGPDGGNGCVFFPDPQPRTAMRRLAAKLEPRKHALPRFDKKTQKWFPGPNGKFWFGWNLDSPPGPADFERLNAPGGNKCPLGDGNEWLLLCPSEVPQSFALGEDGDMVQKIMPGFQGYMTALDILYSALRGEQELTLSDAVPLLATGLAANYRISVTEILALELLNTENAQDAIWAMTDWVRRIEYGRALMEKKTD